MSVSVKDEPAERWKVAWATGVMLDSELRHVQTGHEGAVCAAATAVAKGRPVAVTGGLDKTALIWDLATGDLLGEPFPHDSAVLAVAAGVVGDRPLAVTGTEDGLVRVWHAATGERVGEFVNGHPVGALEVAEVDGRPT